MRAKSACLRAKEELVRFGLHLPAQSLVNQCISKSIECKDALSCA
jgi:hypothetical protein